MSHSSSQSVATRMPAKSVSQASRLLLRQCSCAASNTSLTGECEECKRKKLMQTKLSVGSVDDPLEREAERVADEVLTRGPGAPSVAGPVAIQRAASQASEGAGPAPASVDRALRDPGSRLDTPLREDMEGRFGHDFSKVRVHTGEASAQSARDVQAHAYTVGHDVVFDAGRFAPGSDEGRRLLAHELTHVVQQSAAEGRARRRASDGEATSFGARLAGGGAGLEEEPFMSGLASITPSGQRVVQRAANWKAGTKTSTTNLAAHVIAGKRDMGHTPPTLNGTATEKSADAEGAIKPPTLGHEVKDNGTVGSWVDTVDTNEASFNMQLPSAGPWSTPATKADVAAVFASLNLAAQPACTGPDATTFSLNGKPTDKDFATNVETHEGLHATDHEAGFKAVLVPWDKKLQTAQLVKTKYFAPDQAAADAALFAAMGGTPTEIAKAQFNDWVARNDETHKGATLATGHTATASNSQANAACTTSSIDAT